MWNNTFVDIESLNEVFPSFEVEVKHGLVFRDALLLDFLCTTRFSSICPVLTTALQHLIRNGTHEVLVAYCCRYQLPQFRL